MSANTSRIPGFYRLSLTERQAHLAARLSLPAEHLQTLFETGGLSAEVADKAVENALGTYALPLGLGLNFRINGIDRVVPMVVEEPSVIAAASNAARIVRNSGGFRAEMVESLMTGQVELRDIADPSRAVALIESRRAHILALAANATPSLVQRGGGPRGIEVRVLDAHSLVVHVHIDCQDAMGANLVNTVAEAIGPELARVTGGQLGLRILTNLCDRRRVRAQCDVEFAQLALPTSSDDRPTTDTPGLLVAQAVAAASRFADLDPYRAATHNKGVMNGIDSVVLATGNDYRAVEAGAHAWAARNGRYAPLTTWTLTDTALHGDLELPLALGVVGGTARIHPTARLALVIMNVQHASELIQIAACVGLASNLAALRALGTDGIQRGHMSLHARSIAMTVGAEPQEVDAVARLLLRETTINETSARAVLARLREQPGRPKL